MKFFEITNPYYAVIGAEDEEKCLKFYENVVSEIEDEELFFAELKEIKMTSAITVAANTIDEDTNLPLGIHKASDQVFEYLNNSETCLLDIDGSIK